MAALWVAAAPKDTLVAWQDGDAVELFGGPQGGWHLEYELVVENLDSAEVFVTVTAVNLSTGELFDGGRLGIALIYDGVARMGHVPALAVLIGDRVLLDEACARLDAPLELRFDVWELATGLEGAAVLQVAPTFANGDGAVECPPR